VSIEQHIESDENFKNLKLEAIDALNYVSILKKTIDLVLSLLPSTD
jgi:hypothetical protein